MGKLKLVSNQLSPNLTLTDSLHALWQVFKLNKTEDLSFEQYFSSKRYKLFNSARSALTIVIESIELPTDKKIGIPAYMCAVVAVPFIVKGYQIEWIDTDENGLIDPKDFQKKSKDIGLVLVPHVFGQKAPTQAIYDIAQKNNIFVIKDGAHHFDTDLSDCDALILSFGREKTISCVSGGALLWEEASPYHETFIQKTAGLTNPDKKWILKHLFHPLLFSLTIPLWAFKVKNWQVPLAKCFVFAARQLRVIPLALSKDEKNGESSLPVCKLPLALQEVLMRQFKQMDEQKFHEVDIARKWEQVLTQRFPENKIIIPDEALRVIMFCKNGGERESLLKKAALHNFNLTDWNGFPIAPYGVNLEAFGYRRKSCPVAEDVSQRLLTFPTNKRTTIADIERFARLF